MSRKMKLGNALSTRDAASLLALALTCSNLFGMLPDSAVQAAEGDVQLKMDTPKLDKVPERKTLKGGVSHHEAPAVKAPKLQTGTANAAIKGHDSKLTAGVGKGGGFLNKMFKAKVKADKAPILNAEAASGVGIIGVRFVIGFGLPPTINRVFPGTPAAVSGLRNKDIIVAVDGVPTSGLTKEEVYAMIVGLPDTPVTVSILRDGDFVAKTMKRMDFNDIPDPAVKQDYLLSI